MIDVLSDLWPWLYTDFWLWFCSLKTNKWDGLNSSISFLQKTIRIVSSGVKAIKHWPWLMRQLESLIKSLIEPNAPTVLHPMCFNFWTSILPSTYWTFVLFQSQIHVSLNPTLTPFPHHFSNRWTAARKRHLLAIQSGRIIHMSLNCNLLHYWGLRECFHPDSVLYSCSLCWESSSSFFNPALASLKSSYGEFWS